MSFILIFELPPASAGSNLNFELPPASVGGNLNFELPPALAGGNEKLNRKGFSRKKAMHWAKASFCD